MNRQELYRRIPKVDRLLEDSRIRELIGRYGDELVSSCIREKLDGLREMIGKAVTGDELSNEETEITSIVSGIEKRVIETSEPGLKRVINATGTILHTNLGRAPIGKEFAARAAELMSGYTNIEYDLGKGTRGKRGGRCEELIRQLTGAEDALIVNNNAAAVLLILNGLCSGREVIVSRGELVEIGGHFRMPDVMEASGCRLCEVGTTNKTHLADYQRAVTPRTAAMMKVHTSNFRVIGFTDEVSPGELAELAHSKGLLMIEDLGSGRLIETEYNSLGDEPSVASCLESGADVICFSGDKLLGGPQAGIILGKAEIIEKLRSHPVMRALRPDKVTASLLEMTLLAYFDKDNALKTIPALCMAAASAEELTVKANELKTAIERQCEEAGRCDIEVSIEPVTDQIGGGALPETALEGAAVRIRLGRPAGEAEKQALLGCRIPVIPRFADHDIYLSVRTIDRDDFSMLAGMLAEVL